MIAETRGFPSREAAEKLAVAGFQWMAGEPDLLLRFMAVSGLDPAAIRLAARDPGFLAAVLDFVSTEDAMILAFAGHIGVTPERVVSARRILNGHD